MAGDAGGSLLVLNCSLLVCMDSFAFFMLDSPSLQLLLTSAGLYHCCSYSCKLATVDQRS